MAQAVVVVLTGDDLARLGNRFVTDRDPQHERELTPQARPNVIFEAGLAFGTHPDRTVLVEIGTIRPLTDLGGVSMIRMDGSIAKRHELAARLLTPGCVVDMVYGTDWHTSGNFSEAIVIPDIETPKPNRAPEPIKSPDGRSQAPIDRLKWAIKDDFWGKGWVWRSVATLAKKAGISETEALSLLQLDKEVELSERNGGKWHAKLRQ